MVDTERPTNVQALRALFAQKEKTVIDGLKIPKNIRSEEQSQMNQDENFTNPIQSTTTTPPPPLSTTTTNSAHPIMEKNSSKDSHRLSLASTTSSSSLTLSQKPPVGPKPTLIPKSPSVSSNLSSLSSGFKNIKAQLENSEGMYTSKNSVNSVNSIDKVSSSQESIKSDEIPVTTCDKVTKSNGETQSKLIKKERLSLTNVSNVDREFDEVNLRKPNKAPPKPIRNSLINSSNYISKKQVTEYRRKTLPSLEELGPPPAKPKRPQNLIMVTMTNNGAPPLPERNDPNQEVLTSPPPLPDRILSSRQSIVAPPRPSTGPPPKSSGPKGPPNRPPPTPPINSDHENGMDEELYCDTMDPERAQSMIAEYTEEEECGPRRNSLAMRPRNPPPPPPTSQSANNLMPSTSFDDYSHDTQGSSSGQDEIYEEMPFDSNKGPVYSNSKEQEKQRKKEEKEKEKHEKMCEKLRKKYGLTGEEIPVDAGTVKSDCRGSKTDLTVHKGEMVLILRMENNPVGKWLAKNEKGKIGYVDLANIEVDADSVKSVMKVRVSQALEEDVYSEIQAEDVYECTY